MGLVFSSLWQRLFGSGEHKIVMVGLDNAGKTTILYRYAAPRLGGRREHPAPEHCRAGTLGGFAQPHSARLVMPDRRACLPTSLALNDVIETHPTVGSNVEEVTHRNVKFQVWDLGGQDKLRKVNRPLRTAAGAVPPRHVPARATLTPCGPPPPGCAPFPLTVQVWATYYVGASGVILVVDSMDRARLPQLKEELDVRRSKGGGAAGGH